jgi:hypothetical protein
MTAGVRLIAGDILAHHGGGRIDFITGFGTTKFGLGHLKTAVGSKNLDGVDFLHNSL